MDINSLIFFFKWCSIINGVFFLIWVIFITLAPDFVFRFQSKFFHIHRDSFNIVMYGALGVFKIFLLFFNITPLIALCIIR
ncbi:MAG: hypothetical protein KAT46_07545 [Deltaproteobacteria bacterium]|nr:hypothetical protein [Deltaproteobacteria bacterium]